MDQVLPGLQAGVAPAEVRLELIHRATRAADDCALEFIAVNDTHLLAPYRQAVLWENGRGVVRLSGVAALELNAPYVQWLTGACGRLLDRAPHQPLAVPAEQIDELLGTDWQEWLPGQVLWLPFSPGGGGAGAMSGGLLLARDAVWSGGEVAELWAWVNAWAPLCHYARLRQRGAGWLATLFGWVLRRHLAWGSAAALLAAMVMIPVHISVLAPSELVPRDPLPIRAPLDGVVQEFHVQPNEAVKAGQALFSLDTLQLASRLDVAQQSLATAEAELRQLDQQALVDPKARAALAAARGNIGERRAEVALLRNQRGRATVNATGDGFALFDDPGQWIGRPVATGERIMRIASAEDVEIEAWIVAADAIPLPEGAPVRLYLSTSPMEPVTGKVRYLSHEAARRPEGVYAYRLRARLDEPTRQRIGLKGTVRISGEEVSLLYWIVRRPLGAIREFLGV